MLRKAEAELALLAVDASAHTMTKGIEVVMVFHCKSGERGHAMDVHWGLAP